MSSQKITNFVKPVGMNQGSPHAIKKPGQLTPELMQLKKDMAVSRPTLTPTKLSQSSPAKSPQSTITSVNSTPGFFFAQTTENISRYEINSNSAKVNQTQTTSAEAKKNSAVANVSQIIKQQLQKSAASQPVGKSEVSITDRQSAEIAISRTASQSKLPEPPVAKLSKAPALVMPTVVPPLKTHSVSLPEVVEVCSPVKKHPLLAAGELARKQKEELRKAKPKPAPGVTQVVGIGNILGQSNEYRPRQSYCAVCFREGPFLDCLYQSEPADFIFGKRGEVEGHISCLLATPEEIKTDFYRQENIKIMIKVWKPEFVRKIPQEPAIKCVICESSRGYMNCVIQHDQRDSRLKINSRKAHLACAILNSGLQLVKVDSEYVFQEISSVQDSEKTNCKYCIDQPIKGQTIRCSAEAGCEAAHLLCALNHKIDVLLRLQAKNIPIEAGWDSPDTLQRKFGSPGQSIQELGWYFSYHASARLVTPTRIFVNNTSGPKDQLPLEFLKYMGLDSLGISPEQQSLMTTILEEKMRVKFEILLPEHKPRVLKRAGPNFLCSSHSSGAPIICSCGEYNPQMMDPHACVQCGDWFHVPCIINREPSVSSIEGWKCGPCRVRQLLKENCSQYTTNIRSQENPMKYPLDSTRDQNLRLHNMLSIVASLYREIKVSSDSQIPSELMSLLTNSEFPAQEAANTASQLSDKEDTFIKVSKSYLAPHLDLCTVLALRSLIPINLSGILQVHFLWRYALVMIDDLIVDALCKIHTLDNLEKEEGFAGPSLTKLIDSITQLNTWIERMKNWKLVNFLLLPGESSDVFFKSVKLFLDLVTKLSEFQSKIKIGRANLQDLELTIQVVNSNRFEVSSTLKSYLSKFLKEVQGEILAIKPYEKVYNSKVEQKFNSEGMSNPALIIRELSSCTLEKYYQSNRFLKLKPELQNIIKATMMSSLKIPNRRDALDCVLTLVANFFFTSQSSSLESALNDLSQDYHREKQAKVVLNRLKLAAQGYSNEYVTISELEKLTANRQESAKKKHTNGHADSSEEELPDAIQFDGKLILQLKSILQKRKNYQIPEGNSEIDPRLAESNGVAPSQKAQTILNIVKLSLPLYPEEMKVLDTWGKLREAKKVLQGSKPVMFTEIVQLREMLAQSKDDGPETAPITTKVSELYDALLQVSDREYPTMIPEASRIQTVTNHFKTLRSIQLTGTTGLAAKRILTTAAQPLLVLTTIVALAEETREPGDISMMSDVAANLGTINLPQIVTTPNQDLMTFLCQRPWFELKGIDYYPKVKDYIKKLYYNLANYSIERCISPIKEGSLIPSLPKPSVASNSCSKIHLSGLLFAGELILSLNQKFCNQQPPQPLNIAIANLFQTHLLQDDAVKTLKSFQEKFEILKGFVEEVNVLSSQQFASIYSLVSEVKEVYRKRKMFLGIPTTKCSKIPDMIRWLDGSKALAKYLDIINKFSEKQLTEKNQRLHIEMYYMLKDKTLWTALPLPTSEINSPKFQEFSLVVGEVDKTIKDFDDLKVTIQSVHDRIIQIRSATHGSLEKLLLGIQSLPDASVAQMFKSKVARLPCISMINTDLDRGLQETERIEKYIDIYLMDQDLTAVPLLMKVEPYMKFKKLIDMLFSGKASNSEFSYRLFGNMYFSSTKLLAKLAFFWVLNRVLLFVFNLSPNLKILNLNCQATAESAKETEGTPQEELIFEEALQSQTNLHKTIFGSKLYSEELEFHIANSQMPHYLEQILKRFHELILKLFRGQGVVLFLEAAGFKEARIDSFDTLLRAWARGAFKISGIDIGEPSGKTTGNVLGSKILESTLTEMGMGTSVLGKTVAPLLGVHLADTKQNYSNYARFLWEDFMDIVKRLAFGYEKGKITPCLPSQPKSVRCSADMRPRSVDDPNMPTSLKEFLKISFYDKLLRYKAVGLIPDKVLTWAQKKLAIPLMLQKWTNILSKQKFFYRYEIEEYIKRVDHLDCESFIEGFEQIRLDHEWRLAEIASVREKFQSVAANPPQNGFGMLYERLLAVKFTLDYDVAELLHGLLEAEAKQIQIFAEKTTLDPANRHDWIRIENYFKMVTEFVNYVYPIQQSVQLGVTAVKLVEFSGNTLKQFSPDLPHPMMTRAAPLVLVSYSLHHMLGAELSKQEPNPSKISEFLNQKFKLPSTLKNLRLESLPTLPKSLLPDNGAVHAERLVELNLAMQNYAWKDSLAKFLDEQLAQMYAVLPDKYRKRLIKAGKKESESKSSGSNQISKMAEESEQEETSEGNSKEEEEIGFDENLNCKRLASLATSFLKPNVLLKSPDDIESWKTMPFLIELRKSIRSRLGRRLMAEQEIGQLTFSLLDAMKTGEMPANIPEIARKIYVLKSAGQEFEKILRGPNSASTIFSLMKKMREYHKSESLEKRKPFESDAEDESSEPGDRSYNSDSRERTAQSTYANLRPNSDRRELEGGEFRKPSKREDSTSSRQGKPGSPLTEGGQMQRRRGLQTASPSGGQYPSLTFPEMSEAVGCKLTTISQGPVQSLPATVELEHMDPAALDRIFQHPHRIASYGTVRIDLRIDGAFKAEIPDNRVLVIFGHKGTLFGSRVVGDPEGGWARDSVGFLVLRRPSTNLPTSTLSRLVRESDRPNSSAQGHSN